MKKILTTALLLSLPIASQAAGVGVSSRGETPFFWGGSVGASFGEVDTFSVSPTLGMNVSRNLSTGISLTYTHRKDDRVTPSRSFNDTGVNVFARYDLTPQFFVEADVETLNYEQYISATEKTDKDFTSFMAGGGIRSHLGGNATGYMSALYNFNYDDEDSPYNDPWVIRAGVGFGF